MPLKQYCDGSAFISNISNSRRDGTQSIKDDWYLNYLGNSSHKSVDREFPKQLFCVVSLSFLWGLQRPDIKEDEMNSFHRENV